MTTPKNSFLDSKTVMAIVLVGLCWVAWQSYMQKKYPEVYSQKKSSEQTAETTNPKNTNPQTLSQNKGVVPKQAASLQKAIKEKTVFTYSDSLWSFEISNWGMGIKNLRLFNYKGRDFKPKRIGLQTEEGAAPFETNLIGAMFPLIFDVERVSPTEFVGLAHRDGLRIEKRVKVILEKYVLETQVFVSGIKSSKTFSGLSTHMAVEGKAAEGGFLFLPSFERREAFVVYGGTKERVPFKDKRATKFYGNGNLLALSSQYFSQALLDASQVFPKIELDLNMPEGIASAKITHSILNKSDEFAIKYSAFIGPKSFSLLKSIDPVMTGLIDFGWFGSLAKYILKLMIFFHGFVGNWGLAIIFLTLLVRLAVLPFNLVSFRSMKKMQDIQPQIKALKEKFKDDPKKQQQEMMLLMKERKVNPISGCLPMLLQFPVFIALYQVLGQSIELYQAPFVFWIQDLSLKDPYYVLPVLMGMTMFLQQKLTPTTMDPAQQKVFMIMPVLFALFMVTLPSGLTLYIFVSALFAVLQQVFFLRAKTV